MRKKELPAAPAYEVAAQPGQDEERMVLWLRDELSQIVMRLLKLEAEDVAPDKILLDLGFDSIGLTTFADAVNEKFKLDLTPVLFFDYPSIDEIARHLSIERKADILAAYRSSAHPVSEAPSTGNARLSAPASPVGASYVSEPHSGSVPIAVIGMSGVLPQSDDLEEFWDHLKNGRDLVTVIPRDRWHWEDFWGDPLKETNKSNSKWGGFMKEVDKFDSLFFGISPREAQSMDPQQRILLETLWKAIEDAGVKVSELSGTKTGIFVGASTHDYLEVMKALDVPLDGYSASGNSHSVLANRASFLLNLRGPSAPIDTASSSSLVALHRAVESLQSGSCDMAIAGGVEVMLSPVAYISFSMAGMLSADGKCKAFDKRANGYVRAEGCGLVFLKPLQAAEADGNHIYGVIRSSAENHGGRVSTMTAPNAAAQTALLVEAYEKAQIDPATVGYIEAHGTGTSLGDPIEVQALSKAFAELYKKHGKALSGVPHCALSSVKTNIGHLETAAGIAGVLKVLLALKYKQIPANIHFEELNPYIQLKQSPFYIADRLTPWEAPVAADGSRLPRRAGVSSFGFGGSNAHVVIEEYTPPPRHLPAGTAEPCVFVLSAKNADRLHAYVAAMLHCLQNTQLILQDLAYTLQVGRDEMPERLACVVSSVEELEQRLGSILKGAPPTGGTYRNNIKSKEAKALAADGIEILVQSLLDQRELARVAELWTAGARVDWQSLYGDQLPRRIPLPTYPFARERHWVRGGAVEEKQVPAENVLLHPLVQRNLSTAEANRFTSTFSGDEFFLRDHVVQKQKILPGVAYLEMIRAAGELAQKTPVRVIRNLLWERPLIVGSNAEQVEVSLTPFQSEVKFLVSTGGKNKPVVHCSGKLAYVLENPGPEVMDVQAIQNRCRDEIVTGEDLYPLLNASGLSYGGTFQTIQRICANGTESLAIVQLKKEAREEADRFYLHPGLMDGALHAIFGLVKKNGLDIPLNLPSSVGEVQIFGPLTDLYFAHAAWVDDDARSNPSILKVNLHLLDRNGKVLVCMKDFVARPIQRSAPAAASAPPVPERLKNEAKTLLQSLASVWKPVQLEAEARITLPQSANVLLIAGDEQLLAWLRTDYPNAQILRLDSGTGIEAIAQKLSACTFDQLLWLAPDVGLPNGRENQGSEDIIAEQEAGVLLVFRITKALLQLGYANKKLGWTLVTSRTQAVTEAEVIQPTHAGIVGLVGSLAKEYAQWNIRLLDLDSLKSVTAQHCLTLPWEKQGNALAYRDGKWWQQGLEVIQALSSGTPLYRQEGVYVVIGGAGGLGEVWSKFMMEKYQANIVWIGRRPYDAVIEEKLLNSLTRLGRAPLYVAADAADPESLQQAYETIVSTYPSIHGVVHSAIVLHDQSISRMDEAGFRAGFSAKVDVMVNMDRVFGKQDLDFMLVFSSIISFFKTPGQCNYAAGCTFKDSFALHLHSARGYETKILNWGYWGSVGVAADDFHRKVMEQMGMGSIEPREGMELLEAFIASPLRQVAVIKTLERQAAQGLSVSDAITQHKERLAKNTPGKSASAAADGSTSDASIRQIITEKLSEALYIDADKIPCDTPFSEFGVDSIIGVNLVRSINETLGIDLPMEVLFERTTVAELAELIAKTEKSSGSAIQPADRSQFERLPLSFAQERVWFFEQFEPDSVRYNLPQAITVTGELDVDQLERAFNLIIARHENLRTVFPSEDGEAQQLILNSLDFRLDRVDLTHLQDKQTRTTQAKAVCQAEATRAFDLARGPLLRGQVIKLAEQEHIVLLNMHHIVSDGWSLGVLMRELDLILEAFHQDRTPDLPPLPIQYADYSIWQRDWLKQDGRLQRQLAYWQNKLAALPESLPLPTDYPRPWVRSFAGASHSFTFDPQLSRQLKSVAEQRGGTLFMVLLTAFNILLHRYTEQVDISVGSLIANRQYEETQGLIGMFVNTLVLRNQVEGEDTFSSLFSQVKATCLEAYENQDAPFEKVVDLFRSQRDQAVNPLFQVMFILQNAALGKLDQRYPPYSFDNDLSEFDLTLQLFETADGLTGTIDYATMLYKPETIARMAGHLIGLCQVIVATPAIKICDIRYLSAAEEQLLTIGFNQTKAHYPSDKCLHEHFAEQASVDSERPAVVVAEDGEEAGYSQLYHKSSELALYLRSLGVAPESVVGLCADGAVDFAVGILGILRAGGACLPLDPTSLDDQIAYMLQDSQVDVVLTEEKFSNRLRPLTRQHAKLIMLDEPWPEIATSVDTLTVQGALSGNDVAPHHTAYVMYALGATGKPTGVLLDHQSVMNRIYGLQQRYSLNPHDVVMSGDLSMWELFWTVMVGATLVVPAPGAHKNVRSLTELINRRKVTTLHCTPSTLSKFLQNGGRECASVKRLLCRGEGLDRSTVDRYRTKFPSASLYSHYGQTEAMDVTAYDCAQSPASFVPIGVPAANMQVHILDAHGQLQPIGVPGELHIAGDSLARGYLNRPEMTQQRFVANPFKPGSRMYKSTDRARWLDDGNLQYLGKARQCFALEQMDKTAAETDVSNRQVIDQLYWEDASLDESYEKMTF